MKIQTSRFGELEVNEKDVINLAEGLLGFDHLKNYCIVDPSDSTMILWFQSMDNPEIAFPILEPKIFRPTYCVRLSASELRALELESLSKGDTLVYSILTIPEDPKEMTANLKAPLVINVRKQNGRQVVLQENEYSIKCNIYKELIALMMTNSQAKAETEEQVDIPAVSAAAHLTDFESGVEVTAL